MFCGCSVLFVYQKHEQYAVRTENQHYIYMVITKTLLISTSKEQSVVY
jgi:hypothetical protein